MEDLKLFYCIKQFLSLLSDFFLTTDHNLSHTNICGDKLQMSGIIFLIPGICHLICVERKLQITYFSGQTGVESTVWEKQNIFKHLEVWSLRQSWRFGQHPHCHRRQQYPHCHHHHRPVHHHHHHCDDCQVGDWGVIFIIIFVSNILIVIIILEASPSSTRPPPSSL